MSNNEKYSKLLTKAISIIESQLDKMEVDSALDPKPFNAVARMLVDYTSALISASTHEKKLMIDEQDLNALSDEQLKELSKDALQELLKSKKG